MKILPDYLIEYMPYIEEALEELRLSVFDHAYSMLLSLDVDELTSDEIRQKLDTIGIKVENMTEEWLPNGRFYRMYPSIKHHRTRKNAIQSIVKSGGQFEGVWSNDFSKKVESNYSAIQLLRHYELSLPYDGYFYISGDTSRAEDGTVTSDALAALQSDILLTNALPAGYTYLYVPWPRPVYPDSSGYFYNVNMLQFDRLHYPTWDTHNNNNENIPASEQYRWDYGADTPYRMPYWLDYHYSENTYYTESPIYKKYDSESKIWKRCYYEHPEDYYPKYEKLLDGEWVIDNGYHWPINSASICESSPAVLSNSNTALPTTFYGILSGRTSSPVIDSVTSFNYYYYNTESSDDKLERTTCYLDEGMPYWPDYDSSKEYTNSEFGPYRFDVLSGYRHFTLDSMNHIKTYKPIWSEASPIFLLMQSNFNSGLHPENPANNSFYNLFKFKQDNNIISPYYEEYGDSVIKDNVPAISDITHTSCDRYSIAHLPTDTIAYTRPYSSSQGENKSLVLSAYNNPVYYFSSNTGIEIDPNKTYEITSIVSMNNNSPVTYNNGDYAFFPVLSTDVSNDRECIDLNGFTEVFDVAYIFFKEKEIIETHKFWFDSYSHTDVELLYDDQQVYHESIENWNIVYSYTNYKSLAVEILGIYNSNDELVEYTNNATIELVDFYGSSYAWFRSKFGSAVTEHAGLNYNLNGEWEQLTEYNSVNNEVTILSAVDSTHYVFRSFSNRGLSNSSASMSITVIADSYCTLPFKIVNDSELNYDYVTVYLYKDGQNISTSSFRGIGAWNDCPIVLQEAGEYTITVTYSKDSNVDTGCDSGYIAVLKTMINLNYMSGEYNNEVFTPVTAAYAICKLKKVNTPARVIQ